MNISGTCGRNEKFWDVLESWEQTEILGTDFMHDSIDSLFVMQFKVI